MSKLWVFGLEFLILGVLANVVAHYLIEWYEEAKETGEEERA
ncbi:MAG: hypothetical protein ACLQJ7_11355 [Syntrophobacteraceae bacterium]